MFHITSWAPSPNLEGSKELRRVQLAKILCGEGEGEK